MAIHSTSIIGEGVTIGRDVVVGAGCVIDDRAIIGDGCVLGSYVLIRSGVRLGARNRIGSFTSVGDPPQDVKHDLSQVTSLEIGDDNLIREYCSLHAGSSCASGVTRIGNNNFIMSYVHVGHDGRIGDYNVLANCVGLAGHVDIASHTVFGAYAKVAQFCRIGSGCMVGASTSLHACVPSYWLVSGERSMAYDINKVGMRRMGMTRAQMDNVRTAFRLMYAVQPMPERIASIRTQCRVGEEIDEVVRSVTDLPKGIVSLQRNRRFAR